MNKNQFKALSITTLSALSSNVTYASDIELLPKNPGLPADFDTSIANVISWMLGFVGLLSVLVLIYGGMVYIASSGDQERVGQAKKTIKYALMGLAMAGLAYAIVTLIVGTILNPGT